MAETDVRRAGSDGGRSRFEVTVQEGDSSTRHEVTLTVDDFKRFGGSARSLEELIQRSFEFLLDREPKESILRSFELSEIGRYFPDFEETMAGM